MSYREKTVLYSGYIVYMLGGALLSQRDDGHTAVILWMLSPGIVCVAVFVVAWLDGVLKRLVERVRQLFS